MADFEYVTLHIENSKKRLSASVPAAFFNPIIGFRQKLNYEKIFYSKSNLGDLYLFYNLIYKMQRCPAVHYPQYLSAIEQQGYQKIHHTLKP